MSTEWQQAPTAVSVTKTPNDKEVQEGKNSKNNMNECQYNPKLDKILSTVLNLQTTVTYIDQLLFARNPEPQCRDSWVVYNDECLFFNTQLLNFTDAKAQCEVWGAKLVRPDSQHKQDFVARFLGQFQTSSWWLGLSDRGEEGAWRWIDNNNYVWDYNGWDEAQPASLTDNQDCACFYPNTFAWTSYDCSSLFRSVCEISSTPTLATTPAPTTQPPLAPMFDG